MRTQYNYLKTSNFLRLSLYLKNQKNFNRLLDYYILMGTCFKNFKIFQVLVTTSTIKTNLLTHTYSSILIWLDLNQLI